MRVWVEHSCGWGNLGDDALLISALNRLEHHLGPCSFVLPVLGQGQLPAAIPPVRAVRAPQASLQDALEARPRKLDRVAERLLAQEGFNTPRRAALRALGRRALGVASKGAGFDELDGCDLVYVVGDNSFNDFYPEGVVDRRRLCQEARRRGIPVALSCQGFGPVRTRWARRELRRMLREVDLVSVRDSRAGLELVRRLGPRDLPARVTGDEAFALPAAAGDELLRSAGIAPDEQFVAVNFRTSDCLRDTRFMAPRLASLLDAVGERYRIAFFPMSYGGHWGVDTDYAETTRASMRAGDRLRIVPLSEDPGAVKAAVGRARFTLGLSYHMHVFGLSQGRPAVILYTGPYYPAKSEGLVGFYGAPSAALDLDSVSDSAVLAAVDAIEADYDATCARIAAANERIAADNDWLLEQLAERFGRRAVRAPRSFAAGATVGRLTGLELDEPTRYSIQLDADRHLELDPPYRFLNHSCMPNAAVDVEAREVIALRPIEQGEEITFDYLTTEARMVFPFDCHCGAPGCRGRIAGYELLPAAERATATR